MALMDHASYFSYTGTACTYHGGRNPDDTGPFCRMISVLSRCDLMDEPHAFPSNFYVLLWAERPFWISKQWTFGFRINDKLRLGLELLLGGY